MDRTSIKHNTFINLAGSAIPIVVSLITVPLYLRAIGDTRYGVIAIVWVLFGYFALFDFGLGRATTHHIARLQDPNCFSERESVFWTALFSNAAFGVFGGVLLLIFGPTLFTELLQIPAEYYSETMRSLPWLALAVPVLTISSILLSTLEGQEQFFSTNALATSTTMLSQLAPLAYALWFGPDLSALIGLIVLTRLAGLVAAFIVCLKQLHLKRPQGPQLATLSSLLRYGSWVTVTGILTPLLTTIDRFLIGGLLGVRTVTYYTIPHNFANQVGIIPQSLSRTLFPRFSMLSKTAAQHVAEDSLLTLAALFTPIIVFSLGLLEPFLHVWVGPIVADAAAPVGAILLVGIWFNGLAFIPYALLRGQGRPDLTAKFHLIELLPYLLLLWVGLKVMGLSGAGWAWTIRVGIDFGLLFFAAKVSRRLGLMLLPSVLFVFGAYLLVSLTQNSLAWKLSSIGGLSLVTLCWSYLVIPHTVRDQVQRIIHITVVKRAFFSKKGIEQQ